MKFLRNLSKYDRWFICFVAVLGVLFITLSVTLLAGYWGPQHDKVFRHPEGLVGEIKMNGVNVITYGLDVHYSARGAIAVNQPITIHINGICSVKKDKLDTPESFIVEFYPDNARMLDDEYCKISITANRTEGSAGWAEYRLKGSDIVKFQTSGPNSLTFRFHHGIAQQTKDGVFEIDPSSVTLQLRTNMYLLFFSLITIYLAMISAINMIREIYRDRLR